MRVRAGVVIVSEGHILLMFRRKRGREYYLVPGGGVEPGETVREAAVREAREETNLRVTLGEELAVLDTGVQREHYFEVLDYEGEISLGGEELHKSSEENVYSLEWIGRERLEEITLQPPEVRDVISRCF